MNRRKDGRWQDQVQLPGMKKPKYFYGKTQAEVKKKMAAFRAEQEKGRLFRDCIRDWEAWHDDRVSVTTSRAYGPSVKDLTETFGDERIRSITSRDVMTYLQRLANRDYAYKTVSMRFSVLQQVFNYSLVEGWCETNPCAPVRMPSNLKRTVKTQPDDAVLEAIDATQGEGDALVPFMLMYTGLRIGELLALKWEDIDFEENVIHVTKSVYYMSGTPRIKEPKTEAGTRTVGLLRRLREVLLPRVGEGYIFGGDTPLTRADNRRVWDNALRQAGLYRNHHEPPLVTPHRLRHAYATMLFDAGVDIKDAQSQLGHANTAITQNVYTHIRAARRTATTRRLDEFLDSRQSPVDDKKIIDIKNFV